MEAGPLPPRLNVAFQRRIFNLRRFMLPLDFQSYGTIHVRICRISLLFLLNTRWSFQLWSETGCISDLLRLRLSMNFQSSTLHPSVLPHNFLPDTQCSCAVFAFWFQSKVKFGFIFCYINTKRVPGRLRGEGERSNVGPAHCSPG